MHFFFADDSNYKSARAGMGKLVAFGGVVVEATKARQLELAIDGVASAHGLPAGEEIKWSPRKGSWIYENLQGDSREACYREVLQAAVDGGCKAVVVACDYEMRNLKPEWGFERCVTYALERVSTYLANSQSQGVVITDRPSGGPKEADNFLAAFVDHVNSDHNYMVPDSFAVNMLSLPSHMTRHLQLADLVVAITTAMLSGQSKYASAYFDLVRPMFLQNTFGYIGGTGVKVYPDSLINLYHWVLGETEFSKASMMSAWPLPVKGILFADGDGI